MNVLRRNILEIDRENFRGDFHVIGHRGIFGVLVNLATGKHGRKLRHHLLHALAIPRAALFVGLHNVATGHAQQIFCSNSKSYSHFLNALFSLM